MLELNRIIQGDCLGELKKLPDQSVNCCVTSPPYYGLRDYGNDGQIGLESTPEEYVSKMVDVFAEVKRVLRNDGTLWLNLGDSYARLPQNETNPNKNAGFSAGKTCAEARNLRQIPNGLKVKDLIGIPWMVAFALRSAGWHLRQDIIWHKPNPMPESVTDRCTKAHEYIFLLSKSAKYYYDAEAIKEDSVTYEGRQNGVVRDRMFGYDSKQDKIRISLGQKSFSKGQANGKGIEPSGNGTKDFYEVPTDRNKRSVWTVNTMPYSEAHFATFPERLILDCIKAGCQVGGIVLDPFMGAGTTALVARKLDCNYLGIELNPDYIEIANKRLKNQLGMFL